MMRKLPRKVVVLSLELILLASGTIYSQNSVHDIISFNDCREITITEDPELFVGDDLFNLINGGAELYHEYGFVEVLAFEASMAGNHHLKVEIYDMGSPEAAWGIYSITATSKAKALDAGTAGREGEGFAQFIKGKYMVYLYSEDPGVGGLLMPANCLASNILSMDDPPGLMEAVETGREKLDRIVYFKGNLGLSAIYSFHYKDVFGYEEGAAAIYPDMKTFIFKYHDENDGMENFNVAKEFFLENSKYHDQESHRDSFHMKDRKEQQIDCFLESAYMILFISNGEKDIKKDKYVIIEQMDRQ